MLVQEATKPSGSFDLNDSSLEVINQDVVLPHASGALRKRPWRRHVVPLARLLRENWDGDGTETSPFIVGWMVDDDENPRTWPVGYKWLLTAMVSFTTLVISLDSSSYFGAEAGLMREFRGYQTEVYILGLSMLVLGYAIVKMGPLAWAPLSEVIGRRRVYIFTYALSSCFNGGIVGASNLPTVIILRFIAGCVGSSSLTNSGGTISDIFDSEQRGLALALFSASPFLAPVAGSFLGEYAGWRWVFGLLAILTAATALIGFLFLPETYGPVLLHQRAERLAGITGKVYRSAYERDGRVALLTRFKNAITRPLKLLVREPIVILLSVYAAIVYGTIFLLFTAFPIIYQETRGWSPGIGSLPFLSALVGVLVGLAYYVLFENPRYVHILRQHSGFAPPEARLRCAMVGGTVLPLVLFWFAWTASPKSIHWIASVLAIAPFGFSATLIFLGVQMYLVDAYLIYAASVLAGNYILQNLFGFAFPLFTTKMFAALGINWAGTVLAFLALVCAPMPFLFYTYGLAIRKRCKYAAEAEAVLQMMRDQAAQQELLEHREKSGSSIDERSKKGAEVIVREAS